MELRIFFKNKRKKIFLSVFCFFLSFFLYNIPKEIPYFDEKADLYFEASIKKAVIAYGSTRLINALVSIAKETEVEVSPLGVGLTVHIGQFLDPLDDATERLSSVLTFSIVSLGAMKISNELSKFYFFKILSILVLLLIPIIWISKLKNLSKFFINVILIFFVLRVAFPLSGIFNSYIYNNYFYPKINETLAVFKDLENYQEKIRPENIEIHKNKENGITSKIKSVKENIKSTLKIKETKELISYLWDKKEEIIKAIVNLIILQVSIFVIQVVALPFSVLLLLYYLVKISFKDNLYKVIS